MLLVTPGWGSALNPFWKGILGVLGGITTIAAAWKPITSSAEWWISHTHVGVGVTNSKCILIFVGMLHNSRLANRK